MNVLVFAASLRKNSLNRKLAGEAVRILGAHADVKCDHADFREFEMQMYDGDAEEATGVPAGGQEFSRRARAADAIIISTPEYNGSIPGTFKNALDWASRADVDTFRGKPILLLGATPGGFAAVRSLWHSRQPLEVLGAHVYPDMFGVPKAHAVFDAQDRMTDDRLKDRLTELVGEYLEFARTLSSARP